MLRKTCTWFNALLSWHFHSQEFVDKGPCTFISHWASQLYSCSQTSYQASVYSLATSIKKIYIYIVCICPILAKEVLFSKRINTNVRINISLYLESINFSIYLLLGFIYFIFLNFYLFIFGCAWFSFLRGLFCSCSEQELCSSCHTRASHYGGFSGCELKP